MVSNISSWEKNSNLRFLRSLRKDMGLSLVTKTTQGKEEQMYVTVSTQVSEKGIQRHIINKNKYYSIFSTHIFCAYNHSYQ